MTTSYVHTTPNIHTHNTVAPFDLEGEISPNILSRLEAVGISAQTELAKCHNTVSASPDLLIEKPHTWRNFFDVLKELQLDKLAQKIKKYLEIEQSEPEGQIAIMTTKTPDDTSTNPNVEAMDLAFSTLERKSMKNFNMEIEVGKYGL